MSTLKVKAVEIGMFLKEIHGVYQRD